MTTLARPANQQASAQWNRSLTLHLLRTHGPLSRRQLSQMTGLHGSTFTHIVRELLEKGTVRTAGKRTSRYAGQKQTLLEINPDLGFTVGFDLRAGRTRMVICDAAGQTLDSTSFETPAPIDRMPQVLRTALERRLDELEEIRGTLLGVSVGVPGSVDPNRGLVHHSKHFSAYNLPLGELLGIAFDSTSVICIDHNANFAALAESRQGAARHFSHFVHCLVGNVAARTGPARTFGSLSTALFLGGRLHRGVHFGAGELDNVLYPGIGRPSEPEDVERLSVPDAPLTPAMEALALSASRCLGAILNLLDPQAVIIGNSRDVVANRAFLELLQRETLAALLPVQHRNIAIVPSTLGNSGVALGGAIAAADQALIGVREPVFGPQYQVEHLTPTI